MMRSVMALAMRFFTGPDSCVVEILRVVSPQKTWETQHRGARTRTGSLSCTSQRCITRNPTKVTKLTKINIMLRFTNQLNIYPHASAHTHQGPARSSQAFWIDFSVKTPWLQSDTLRTTCTRMLPCSGCLFTGCLFTGSSSCAMPGRKHCWK